MSSKKSKSKMKKVSQNDLRKMMNEVRNKRTADPHASIKEERKTLSDVSAYKKALNDRKKIQALVEGSRSPASASGNPKTTLVEAKIGPTGKPEVTKSHKRSLPTRTLALEKSGDSGNGLESKKARIEPEINESDKKFGILAGDYSSDSEEETEQKAETKAEEKDAKNEPAKLKQPDSSLPEGFFDDPEVDAKVRGVETPADAMDREWEEFQREIQRETGQSDQIVEEEEETGKVDREIEEIDEQMIHFSKVRKLDTVRSKIKEKRKVTEAKKESSESEEESGSEDAEDLLDWREKDSHF